MRRTTSAMGCWLTSKSDWRGRSRSTIQRDDRREREDEHDRGDRRPALREPGAVARRGQAPGTRSRTASSRSPEECGSKPRAHAPHSAGPSARERLDEEGEARAGPLGEECLAAFQSASWIPSERVTSSWSTETLGTFGTSARQLRVGPQQSAALAALRLGQELGALVRPAGRRSLHPGRAACGRRSGEPAIPKVNASMKASRPRVEPTMAVAGAFLALGHARPAPHADPVADLVAGQEQQHGPGVDQPDRAPVEKGVGEHVRARWPRRCGPCPGSLSLRSRPHFGPCP